MSLKKISLFLALAVLGAFIAYKISPPQAKELTKEVKGQTIYGQVADDWQVLSNEKYGYEAWCAPDFDCQYQCEGFASEESFCAQNKTDKTIKLILTQYPIKNQWQKNLVLNTFDSRISVPINAQKILDQLNEKILNLGQVTKIDAASYNITGVDRLEGFKTENKAVFKTNIAEEWFFVKNDLLYHAKLEYGYGEADRTTAEKSAETLHHIFGTVSF